MGERVAHPGAFRPLLQSLWGSKGLGSPWAPRLTAQCHHSRQEEEDRALTAAPPPRLRTPPGWGWAWGTRVSRGCWEEGLLSQPEEPQEDASGALTSK